jgi:hypothetical protein
LPPADAADPDPVPSSADGSPDDLPVEAATSAEEGLATVQDVEAAPPPSEGDLLTEPVKGDGPPTRVEAVSEPTIDAQKVAPTPQNVATQPETESAPDPVPDVGDTTDPLALADDLFAGLEGAMDSEVLARLSKRKPISTKDLEAVPSPPPEAPISEADREFFKKAMRGSSRAASMSITQIESLDSEAMDSLRKEFDVVATMEASNRRRKIIAGVTIALVAIGVVGSITLYRSQREGTRAANQAEYERDRSNVPTAERRAIYDATPAVAPKAEGDVIDASAPEPVDAAVQEKQERLARLVRWEAQKAAAAERRAKRTAESRATYEKLTPGEFEALMADSEGKTETKLKFSARKNAEVAAKAAEAKRKKQGDARAAEVVATFGRKRRQLARCKSGEDEKVRAQFTVAPNGRVTSISVTGTKNSKKRDCVKGILKLAIFPKGPETNTYAMPFTL